MREGPAAVIWSERALADTDPLFAAAVDAVCRKLSRVEPIEVADLPADRLGLQAALDEWAGDDPGTWRREMRRFYEQHLGVHVRPDPDLNAVLRALAAAGVELAVWSPGPEEAVELLLAQIGVARTLRHRCFGGAAELARTAAGLPPPTVAVVADADEAAAASSTGLEPLLAGWREPDLIPGLRLLATAHELLASGAAVP